VFFFENDGMLFNRCRRRVRRQRGYFPEANPICRRKNIFFADFAAGALALKQNLEGVAVEGEILPFHIA